MTIEKVRNKLFNLQNDNTVKINDIIKDLSQLQHRTQVLEEKQTAFEHRFDRIAKWGLAVIPLITVLIPLITTTIDHHKPTILPSKIEKTILKNH